VVEKKRKCIPIYMVALELGVSERHVYNLLRANLLEAIDISVSGSGGPQSLRVPIDSLVAFKRERRIIPEDFFDKPKN